MQNLEQELQSRMEAKDRELAEIQQQLRQKVTILLVEMFNIVGERERPNSGFGRNVRAA